jgi:hypothetical protein
MFKYRPTNYRTIRKICKGLYQTRYTKFRDDRLGKNSCSNDQHRYHLFNIKNLNFSHTVDVGENGGMAAGLYLINGM